MSQAKVDRYKKEKANRKKTVRREKIAGKFRTGAAVIVCAVLIGWVGYSVHNLYEDNKGVETVEIDYSSLNSFSTNLAAAGE